MAKSTGFATEPSTQLIVAKSVNDTPARVVPETAVKLIDPARIKIWRKPAKKKDDEFPLWFHGSSGRWCRTIKKTRHYFGTDKQAALDEWLRVKDYLLNGRTAPPKDAPEAGPTVKFVCDSFLSHKEQQRDNGEIQRRTFDEMFATCIRIAAAFGRDRLVSDLGPNDFRALRKELAKTRGLVSLGNEMQRIRSVFKFAFEDDVIDAPVKFGKGFDKPSRDKLRIESNAKGRRDLDVDQVRKIIAAAGVPLKAMVLLAVNCGFGNNDVGTLPIAAVDLAGGWVSYSRPKTGVARRAKLWPETVEALKAAIDARPDAKQRANAGLVFITKHGAPWAKGEAGNDPVNGEFKKVLVYLGFHRDGIGFYSLRRSFRTVADRLPDVHAVNLVMGHAADGSDMGARYTQVIDDDRLAAVADHVRAWLFTAEKTKVK